MQSQPNCYVGIDWGRTRHEVCVLDANRQILARRTLHHCSEHLMELAPWLLQTTGGDAFVIARALATDSDAFRLAPVLTEQQHLLRTLVHERDQLVKQKVKYCNQLKELLWSYFPAVLEAVKEVSQKWFLQLLLKAPTPDQARRLQLGTLKKLLKRHRIRRIDAPTLQQLLRQPPLPGSDRIAPASPSSQPPGVAVAAAAPAA